VSSRVEQFAEVYRQERVGDQRAFYEDRAATFQAAHRQLVLVSAVVLGISATIGLLAGLDIPGKLILAIGAAILPAATTVISAYEGVYGFERVAKLYRDAARNLRLVEPPELADGASAHEAMSAYVADVERILKSEGGQWGQLALETAEAND